MNSTFTEEQIQEIERIIKLQKIKEEVGQPYFHSFDNQVTRWNQNNAYCFARLSDLAYEESKTIKERLYAYDDKLISEFKHFNLSKTDTQFFTIITKEDVIVSFRGTSNLKDWKNNFRFKKVDFGNYGKGKVHKGFYDAFLESWPHLSKVFNKNPDKKIWITGHSLGGAIATLTLAAIITLNPSRNEKSQKIGGLYTFGQPKVGDKVFVNHFKGILHRVVRVVYCNDPVPIVPFPFYQHVGASKKISRKGGFRFLRSNIAHKIEQGLDLAFFSFKVLAFFFFARSKFSSALLAYIERHDMEKYIRSFNLKENA